MTTTECVLGVLPVCRVVSLNPTQPQATNGAGCGGCVLGVLGLRARARVYEFIFSGLVGDAFFSPREDRNTQQTQHTLHSMIQSLVFIGFVLCWVCVGLGVFVLGWVFDQGERA